LVKYGPIKDVLMEFLSICEFCSQGEMTTAPFLKGRERGRIIKTRS